MKLTLVLPALFRDDTEHLPTLHTPALNQLWRFGNYSKTPYIPSELYARFLWNGSLRAQLLAQINMPSETPSIIVSPVCQQMEMTHISILEASAIGISPDEAHILCQDFTQFYQPDNYQFHAILPDLWLAVLPQTAQWQAPPILDVYGQTNGHWQAQGQHANQWFTMQTEMQMFLHNHTINRTRADHQQPEINGVWLWQDLIGQRSKQTLACDSTWAHLANPNTLHAPFNLDAFYQQATDNNVDITDGIIFLDDLAATRHTIDNYAYQHIIQQWDERFFAPVWQMLKTGNLTQLHIISDGINGGCLSIKTKAHRAFWKRRKNFQGLPC